MNQLERAVEVGARIKELRAELAHLEAELNEMLPKQQSAPGKVAPASRERSESLPSRILHLIESEPGRRFGASELSESLGEKVEHVRAALFRLKEGKRIRKIRKGKYRALPAAKPNGEMKTTTEEDARDAAN